MIKALIFDVFGTCVDWRNSVAHEVEIAFPGIDSLAFADAWRAEYDPAMRRIREGGRGYVARDVSGLGTRTIAMALHDSTGKPFASLSVSTIRDRMQGEHLECVVAALGEEVATIREKLSRLRPQHTG